MTNIYLSDLKAQLCNLRAEYNLLQQSSSFLDLGLIPRVRSEIIRLENYINKHARKFGH